MHPTFTIPILGLTLPATQVMNHVATVVCLVIGPWLAWRLERLPPGRVLAVMTLGVVPPLAGGRLHFLLNNPSFFEAHPWNALKIWTGPIHTGGALLAAVVTIPILARWCGVPARKLGDALVPTVGLGLAIAKVGCLLAGCCFGTVCDHAWCLTFPPGAQVYTIQAQQGLIPPSAPATLPVHPLPLYILASGLLLTAVGLLVHRVKRWDGEVVCAGLLFQGLALALLEYFRSLDNFQIYWGPLPQLAWTGLAIAVLGAVGLTVGGRGRIAGPVRTAARGAYPTGA